ncbi:HNH endonuclease [Nocardioides sp.]|uniref:HNH endonuclease n=1 Tax=Nocardioides sp. TaxID=35761 RepID=UPI003512A1C2
MTADHGNGLSANFHDLAGNPIDAKITTSVTADRRADIRARLDAATPGPWEERWLPVPGCDGYEVSDFGNVRSFWLRGNPRRLGKKSPTSRNLARRQGKAGGYPSVSLPRSDGDGYRSKLVHRLVIETFVGPCPPGHEVAHLNGDRTDARLANLAYVTHVENEAHKRSHGTHGAGETHAQAKWQGWQVEEMKYLSERGIGHGKIAALFDTDHKTVSQILSGKTWGKTGPRADLAWLLDEVERLEGERDEWRDAAKANAETRDRLARSQHESHTERDAARATLAALVADMEAVHSEHAAQYEPNPARLLSDLAAVLANHAPKEDR